MQGLQGDSVSDHQCADAFGAIQLVGAEAHQINPQGIWCQGDMTEGLGGVAVKGDALVAAHCGQGHQGLEHPDFIVGRHHAHQLRLGGDRLLQLLGGDQSIGAWGQQGDAETFPLQLLERIEYGVVFGGHADQMAAAPGPGMAQQGQVVGFRGTTGEHQLLWRHRQRIRDLPPCQVHRR